MRPSRNHPTRLTLVGFAILYVVVFALAVQLSDFRAARYYVPAYPFLFFLVAHSVARWQDRFPRVQRQIHTVFLADVVLLALGTHAPLLSLDRPGYALSTKGYAYAEMPFMYLTTHAPHLELYALTGSWNPQFHREGEREFFLELVQRPFLSDILPKLSSDDQRELSFALVQMLAGVAPLNGQAEDFARLERLVPPGFDRYLYYLLGAMAMARHSNVMPQAVAAVEFLRHQTPAMHHLALVGIYQQWPQQAGQDRTPDSLISAPAAVTPALAPHYWRALGHWAGGSWYNTEGSLSLLTARLQEFVPRLNPSVQRYVLQGVGKLLFDHFIYSRSVAPAELERFPHTYQEGLLEGWGMALGEEELYSEFPWKDQESPFWTEWTKGFSARSLVSVQRGKAQFEALFEGPASSALKPPRHTP